MITTPSLAAGASGVPKAYVLCVYTTTPALLGQAAYTVYSAPTVTTASLTKGPSSGGQAVAIDGTNFTAKSTVTVGGVAATGVKFTSATALSFVTPKTTAGATNIVVTTEGGKSATGAGNVYTSLNAVVVSPKTGIVDGGEVITVTGAGFDVARLRRRQRRGVRARGLRQGRPRCGWFGGCRSVHQRAGPLGHAAGLHHAGHRAPRAPTTGPTS